MSGQYREYNLINSNEIRTIANDEMLVVSSNKQPAMLKSKAYFENWAMKRHTKNGAVDMVSERRDEKLQKVEI